MTLTLWPEKDPVEKLGLIFTYTPALDVSETINTVAFSVVVKSGVDSNAAAMLDGATTLVAGQVFQRIKNGVDGVVYLVRCDASLSSGRVLALAAHLPVKVLA